MGAETGGGSRPGSPDDLQQAMRRILAELTRLGGEIEQTANEQIKQRRPELRRSMDDLDKGIDVLAVKAKALLGDLKTRLDEAGDEPPPDSRETTAAKEPSANAQATSGKRSL